MRIKAKLVKATTTADIEKWIAKASESVKRSTKGEKSLDFTKGGKYYRVFTFEGEGRPRYAYCFIDMEGNIYKADGWKRPAKGIRGHIDEVDPTKLDQHTSWLYRKWY